MKLLLLGANGQVGFELKRALAPLGDVVCATRSGRLDAGARCEMADLSNSTAMNAVLARVAPTWVVNAAAFTAVDRAEDEPAAAHAANADAPGLLARWCAEHAAQLVHYSTDYVFDGRGTRPYLEDDVTAPLSEYGRSKLAGEQAVAQSGARHLIFRTGWVYAARGNNFLLTMLRLGRERELLRIVADQRGAPTPARWIAAATTAAVSQCLHRPLDAPSGVFHLTAAGETSWCEFSRAIFEDAKRAGVLEKPPQVEAIGTGDYPTRAVRPAYSCLDGRRLRQAFKLQLPDWRQGTADVVAELASSGAPA
jgi:dTDP-4-dehydrorhamnose reductase